MANTVQIYALLLRKYLARRKALRGDLRGFNGTSSGTVPYRVEARGSDQFVVWNLEDWTQGGGEPFRRSDDSR